MYLYMARREGCVCLTANLRKKGEGEDTYREDAYRRSLTLRDKKKNGGGKLSEGVGCCIHKLGLGGFQYSVLLFFSH